MYIIHTLWPNQSTWVVSWNWASNGWNSQFVHRMSHHHMERIRASTLSLISCGRFRAQQRKWNTPKNKRVLRDLRDIQIFCLVNYCWIHYSDLKHSPLRDVTSISCFGKHLCSCTKRMTTRTVASVLSVDRFHLFHWAQHLGHSLFAAPRECSEMGRETDRRSERTLCRSHHLPRPMPHKWPRALSLEGNYLR